MKSINLESESDIDAPLVYSDHQHLDARSLALHCLIARKLLENPALIDLARSTLVRWKAQAPSPCRHTLSGSESLKRALKKLPAFWQACARTQRVFANPPLLPSS
jgi:hypothetical protein